MDNWRNDKGFFTCVFAGIEGKSLKEIIHGMKIRDNSGYPPASAEDALEEIERFIAAYRAGQQAQRQALGE